MKLKNCNAEQFIENLNGRKVVCFGAGALMISYEAKKIEHLEEYIAFFVDNDKGKQGKRFQYAGREFDVKSADVLRSINVEKYVLLITCTFYMEVYGQLKDIPELKEIECYMYDIVGRHPNLDVEEFFAQEIRKKPFQDWKQRLASLHLRDKHKGERCFVIGNGPSLTIEDLELLKGEVTFAANRVYTLFDRTGWRPTYYFCEDYVAYGADYRKINKINAQLRFIPLTRAFEVGKVYSQITYYNRGVNCIKIKDGKSFWGDFRFSEDVEEIVWGGPTVLYDILQFAVYMGFSQIYLLGVDCSSLLEILEDGSIVHHAIGKDHFDDDYSKGFLAAPVPLYAYRLAFQKAKEICESRGITIKNATRGGMLETFERISLEELTGA